MLISLIVLSISVDCHLHSCIPFIHCISDSATCSFDLICIFEFWPSNMCPILRPLWWLVPSLISHVVLLLLSHWRKGHGVMVPHGANGIVFSCSHVLVSVYCVGATLGHDIYCITVMERRCREWDSNPGQLDQSPVVKPLGHRGLWDRESISMTSFSLSLLGCSLCLLFRLSQEENDDQIWIVPGYEIEAIDCAIDSLFSHSICNGAWSNFRCLFYDCTHMVGESNMSAPSVVVVPWGYKSFLSLGSVVSPAPTHTLCVTFSLSILCPSQM